VCRWPCSLAAVRGRCCTFALYVVQLTPCLQSDVSARVSGSDLSNRLSVGDRHVPLVAGVNDVKALSIITKKFKSSSTLIL
jgi:hypothetical protein